MGFGNVTFAGLASFIGAGSIEISQAGEPEPVGTAVGLQGLLEKKFGYPIGVDRLAGRVLGDRNRVR